MRVASARLDSSIAVVLLLTFGQVALVGCWSGETSRPISVSGTVTVSDQKLSGAVITFEPMGGTPGPKVSVPIFDGQYKVEPKSRLQPGKYIVRISMLPSEIASQIPNDGLTVRNPRREISPAFDRLSKLTTSLVEGENRSVNFEVAFR